MDILDLMERAGALAHQRELDYFAAAYERASRFVLWHTAGAGAVLLVGYGQPFAALVAAQGLPEWVAVAPVFMAALWFAAAAWVMFATMGVATAHFGASPVAISSAYSSAAVSLGVHPNFTLFDDADSRAAERKLLVQTRRACIDGQSRDIAHMAAMNGRRATALRWGYIASICSPIAALVLAWLLSCW